MPGKQSMDRPLCRGQTKTGQPCRKKAAAGSAYCGSHGGGKTLGAPTKLTDATIELLDEAVSKGIAWSVAANIIGVHKTTLLNWREKGAADLAAGKTETPYAVLVDRLTRATARSEQALVAIVKSHARTDWRAAAFLLERRHAERWARQDRLDVEVQERAEPRTVTPGKPARNKIIEILGAATKAPNTTT